MSTLIPRSSFFWFGSFVVWFAVLWYLSSGPLETRDGPEIPHIDKIAHFGYFFGGAGLLSAFLFRHSPEPINWVKLTLIVTITLACVGLLDEYHQSHIPGRSGNDLGDLIADICGALAGTLVFKKLHRFLK